MTAMDRTRSIEYDFYGSGTPMAGIKHSNVKAVRNFVVAPFRVKRGITWQSGAIAAVRKGDYDAVIFLADPNFASTWIASLLARLKGIPVLFWGHGWLKRESRLKSYSRRAFFQLADRFMTYSERGMALGIQAGYPEKKLSVIYNSLDVVKADAVVGRIEAGELASLRPQSFFAHPHRPVLICSARLTEKCRFDLLIDAAALLSENGMPVNVVLVGDGPQRQALEDQAKRLGVATHFVGACYDEDITGQLIYHADVTVSPGKIGLTAMHSLMYGTPAITHNDLDEQMPEVEAIEDGRTGLLFRRNDPTGLAKAIQEWLGSERSRASVREECRSVIREKWNPENQARLIEKAVLAVADRG
ncbi:hypothetical protein BES08_11895 [Novosphingobium resinovorum]|uniref:Glycosyltransferase n=2 Tax=Novosphingobium resinovorum TaxID=158500 RepID=A0A1D8A5K0_9SPHN|nr:hypothetical protein BES08_11895 [Novosphingobium resinovorum]